MTFAELIKLAVINDRLKANPPACQHCGQPLDLVHSPSGLSWENSLHVEWWNGMADGVYPDQIVRPVSIDEIESAALALGLDEVAVRLACATAR